MSGNQHTVKKNASKWKYSDLQNIGLDYENSSRRLIFFSNTFKHFLRTHDDRDRRRKREMIFSKTNEFWNFIINIKGSPSTEKAHIQSALTTLNNATDEEDETLRR